MRPDPFKGGTLTTMYEQHWPLHFVCGVEGRHCVVDSGGLRLEHLGTISVSVFVSTVWAAVTVPGGA